MMTDAKFSIISDIYKLKPYIKQLNKYHIFTRHSSRDELHNSFPNYVLVLFRDLNNYRFPDSLFESNYFTDYQAFIKPNTYQSVIKLKHLLDIKADFNSIITVIIQLINNIEHDYKLLSKPK